MRSRSFSLLRIVPGARFEARLMTSKLLIAPKKSQKLYRMYILNKMRLTEYVILKLKFCLQHWSFIHVHILHQLYFNVRIPKIKSKSTRSAISTPGQPQECDLQHALHLQK